MRVPFLVLLASAGALGGANFKSIDCPNTGSRCSYRNSRSVDEAVSIFFQVELASGESQGSFSCGNGKMTYCSRKYAASDSGSAGDCFFVLPAGESFDCTVQGTVNFIGSHAAPMAASNMLSTVTDVPCSGASCSYTNSKNTDMWVSQSFEAAGSNTNSMSCSYNSIEVCSYSVGNSVGGYSCNYILPAGATVTCKVDQGRFNMLTSAAASFKGSYLSASAKAEPQWNCPNVTYPLPNLCDCDYTNPHNDKDLVVTVTSSSVDENYNSFHCYFGGANVCAWGSNTNDKGNRGGCYFILPAGEQFECQMEWGAASFSVSTALLTNGTMFGNSRSERKRAAPLEEPVDGSMTLQEHKDLFAAWKAENNKKYATEVEEETRFANFRRHITAFLKKSDAKKTLPNSLADWSKAEFETYLRDCSFTQDIEMPAPPAEYVITEQDVRDAPESVDWRTKGVLTPVKNQGQCGSCWSFSATGAMESAWAIAGNGLTSLSEQELVSCDTADGNAGCNGGWPYKAIDYVRDNGDATEESYPYVSGNGNAPGCSSGHSMADIKVTGYYSVNKTEEAMAAAVAKYGPVSISLDAMTQLWWPYTGGIMTGCCNHQPDHAVLIVGYGVESGTKYWIIKNSWGASWGENGYIRLERGTNQCGITSAPVLAVVQGSGPNPPGPTPPTPPTPPSPPTPPTPPTPPSGDCPQECVKSTSNGMTTCTWQNGTNSVIIPPNAIADCTYFAMYGSFSYIWNGAVSNPSSYPCPPSSVHQEGKNNEEFCVFYNGMNGLNIPQGGTVDCSQLDTSGSFSYSYSS